MAALQNDERIGVDLETGGLNPFRDPIAVVSLFGEQSENTAVLHVRGSTPWELKTWLARKHVLWIGHNVAGFDILFLAANGIRIHDTRYYDTLIAEQVTLASGRRDVRVRLQDTVARRLGVHLKKGMGESTWMAPELTDEQLTYCLEDVFYLPKLRVEQMAKIEGTPQAKALEFELRVMPVIAKLVLNGLPLDMLALEQWRKDMVVEEIAARETINALASPTLNVNSSKQIIALFTEKFGIPITSSDAETLAMLKQSETDVGKLAAAIQTSRKSRKRTGMYDNDWVDKYVDDGRVHSRFWQSSTDTFRMSSSDPNLQQIPRNGRKIFGGVYGHKMVSVDFQQLEVRVAAALAQDTAMQAALESGDIHTWVASGIFQKEQSEVTKTERQLAKAATFTLLFGGSAEGLVRYALISIGHVLPKVEAERIVLGFFRTFPGLHAARVRAQRIGREGKPVTLTLPSGARRVLIPEWGQVKPSQILNTMVQGTAAIGLKWALIEADARGLTEYLGSTVHDELLGCVPDAEVEAFTHALKEAMVEGMKHVLPNAIVGVEEKVGDHWS